MTLEEKIELFRSGVEKGVYPRLVYKFRDLGARTFEIIEKSEVWFASANSFNDPFDCDLSETRNHTKEDLENYLKHLDTELGIEKHVFSGIIKRFDSDPAAIREICMKARSTAVNSRGILSLSETCDDILMWSHYAKDHTGVVFGFSVMEDPNFFLDPFKVQYVKEYEPLNYFKNRNETITRNITTKSQHWAYEKEIRIIAPECGLRSFKRNCLQTVHFGCKTKEDDIERVKALSASNGFGHVKFFRARKRFGYFGLEFDPI